MADYEDGVTAEEAKEVMAAMERFIGKAESYLSRHQKDSTA
jgi:hypothetical protein